MSHVRTQIREQMKTELLAAALTILGSRVETTRLRPTTDDQLPAVFIRSGPEPITATMMRGTSGRALKRECNILVNVHAAGNAGLDTLLDDCCVEVEDVLGPSILNGLVKSLTLVQTDFAYNEEVAVAQGVASMTWKAVYATSEADASQAL